MTYMHRAVIGQDADARLFVFLVSSHYSWLKYFIIHATQYEPSHTSCPCTLLYRHSQRVTVPQIASLSYMNCSLTSWLSAIVIILKDLASYISYRALPKRS